MLHPGNAQEAVWAAKCGLKGGEVLPESGEGGAYVSQTPHFDRVHFKTFQTRLQLARLAQIRQRPA